MRKLTPFLFLLLSLTLPQWSLGQTDCVNEAQIQTIAGAWAEEISWSLLDSDNQIVATGNNYDIVSEDIAVVCLDDSCYTLELMDSFGDGWNGGMISVNFEALGIMIGPLTMESGSYASFAVGVDPACNGVLLDGSGGSSGNGNGNGNGNVEDWGCMDPEALNFDSDATLNCCCQYPLDCSSSNTLTVVQTSMGAQDWCDSLFQSPIAEVWINNESAWWSSYFQEVNDQGQWVMEGCIPDGCYNVTVFPSSCSEFGSIEFLVNGEAADTLMINNLSMTFGALGVNQEGCEYSVPGCTDPEASNWNPEATEDDGSCDYPVICSDNEVAAQLYICTFSAGNEVALNITDSQGNVLFDQSGFPDLTIDYLDVCIDPTECYTATMTNIAGGTSWNGGYFWIESANGTEWTNGALEGSSQATIEFGTGDGCDNSSNGGGRQGGGDGNGGDSLIFGCTDPLASNYNPLALLDDGSCVYPQPLDCDSLNEVSFLFVAGNDLFLDEVSWSMTTDDGTVMMTGSGQVSNPNGEPMNTACIPDGCYNLELYDSFGDGWGGGQLIMIANDIFSSYTIEAGNFESFAMELGDGCDEEEPGVDEDIITNPGMSTWDDAAELSAYPSPAEDIVNIIGSGFDHESPVVVNVRDGLGRISASKTIPEGFSQTRWTLNVADWAAGIYTIEGIQNSNRATSRIVVVR